MILRCCNRTLWGLAFYSMILLFPSGCRSTSAWNSSRWNPTSWFSSREPDASMIAGRTGAPDLPTSPALNHTPTALAQNYGATGGSPANGLPNSGTASVNGSPFAFGSQPETGTLPPSGGLAARSNGFQTGAYPSGGYQTGPYGMSPTTSATANVSNSSVATVPASASSVVAAPNVSSNPVAGALPSPYGGSYSANGQTTGVTVDSFAGVTQAPFGTQTPTSGTPTAPSWGMPDYPSLPTGQVSATQVSVPMGNVPMGSEEAYNPNQSSSATPWNATQPAPSAYQSAPPSGNFAPGTTGRNTNYNFGNGGSSGYSPPSTGLPPNTATGSSPWLR